MIATRIFLWVGMMATVSPLSAAVGQKPGQLFTSPLKNFSVPVPNFAFGTRVQKSTNANGGYVVFHGGFGELAKIDYARIHPEEYAAMDSTARVQSYRGGLEGFVQLNHGEQITSEPVSQSGDLMYYALVRFPGASAVTKDGQRLDSVRGILLLVRGEFFYQLSVDVGGGGLFGPSSREEQLDRGKTDVLRFLGEIQIAGAPVVLVPDTIRATLADAGQIAFSSTRDGNYEIYVVNADGSNPTRLTDNQAEDRFPAWSPDGSQIAFVSDRDGNPEIYVMNADGTASTRLTTNPEMDGGPAWLPDGKRIVFASVREDGAQLYVVNADGSNLVKLTTGPAVHFDPNWSADGTRVTGISASNERAVIFAMNADGTNVVELTLGFNVHPVWSPDGAKIVFASNRDGNGAIYVMNADGSQPTRLTRNKTEDMLPTWSPDGRRIVFHSDRDGDWEIYVMNADGTGQVNITRNAATDVEPHWRPRH